MNEAPRVKGYFETIMSLSLKGSAKNTTIGIASRIDIVLAAAEDGDGGK